MKGILKEVPIELDGHYCPTTQDLRNITKSVVHKMRKNTFDQDALEIQNFNIIFESTKTVIETDW